VQDDGKTGPELYRQRAAEMLKLAEKVSEESERKALLDLASTWTSLAQLAEKPAKPIS